MDFKKGEVGPRTSRRRKGLGKGGKKKNGLRTESEDNAV